MVVLAAVDDLTPILVFPILVSHDFRCAVPSSTGGGAHSIRQRTLTVLLKEIYHFTQLLGEARLLTPNQLNRRSAVQ